VRLIYKLSRPFAEVVVGEPVYKIHDDSTHAARPVLLVAEVNPRRQVVFDDADQVPPVTGLRTPDFCEAVPESRG
jgi:hypothetical protein